MLQPQSDGVPAPVAFETVREHELLLELDSLNTLLTRVGRR